MFFYIKEEAAAGKKRVRKSRAKAKEQPPQGQGQPAGVKSLEDGWHTICNTLDAVPTDKIDVDKIDEAAMLQVRFALQGELTEEPELDALADPSLRNSAEVSVKYGDEGDDEDDKDGDADGEEDCPPAKR